MKNIKKNHQEKYNLMFNQIIFSSNIDRNSKVLVIGLIDNVLIKDLINRGYTNVYYSDKYEDNDYLPNKKNNEVFDMIEYDTLRNDNECSKYDLLIISTGYDVSKVDKEFNHVLKSLRSGGSLILLFSAYVKAYSPVWTDIRDLYKISLPNLFDGDVMSLSEQLKKLKLMLNSREQLEDIKSHNYNWIEEYTLNEYCSLLECSDYYKSMNITNRLKLTASLNQTIDKNGGSLKKANHMTVVSCNKL
ncbi:MAG: hypothetical protein WBA54_10425 [Acidaminobacteraceae bacterium]